MTTNEKLENWERRFDEKFKYFSGHEMLQTSQGHDIIKSFFRSELDQARQEERDRLAGEITRYLSSKSIYFDEKDSWQFCDKRPYVDNIDLSNYLSSLLNSKE